jgi:hypothetical protein
MNLDIHPLLFLRPCGNGNIENIYVTFISNTIIPNVVAEISIRNFLGGVKRGRRVRLTTTIGTSLGLGPATFRLVA